jgi:hypothetical protein
MSENQYKEVSYIKTYVDGAYFLGLLIPYTKVWSFEAYDNYNILICSIYDVEKSNYIKYIKFVLELKKYGFVLTEKQKIDIRKELMLETYNKKDDNDDDFYEINELEVLL